MIKKRIIPNVPKEDRVGFEYGYHKLPTWLFLILFVSIIFLYKFC